MKVAVVLLALLGISLARVVPNSPLVKDVAGSNLKYIVYEKKDGTLAVEDLRGFDPNAVTAETQVTSASDVEIYFSSRDENQTLIADTSVVDYDFKTSRKTAFIIHGWNNDKDSDVNTLVRDALLENYDVNVFVIDWSSIATQNYIKARNNVKVIGETVADFILTLVDSQGLDLDETYLFGHSLGAHVAGNAGAALDGKVAQIVGMDPAGPLFTTGNIDNRIDPTDGQYVHIIHTSGWKLGFGESIGHSDYFPNGGSSQPGCGWDLISTCAHGRSFELVAESLAGSTFYSTQCDSYDNWSDGECDGNHVSSMGGMDVDKTASGDYYLDTNEASPYCVD